MCSKHVLTVTWLRKEGVAMKPTGLKTKTTTRRAKSPVPPVPQPPTSLARHGGGTEPLPGAWWKSCEGSEGKVSFQHLHAVVWCLVLKVISFVLSNLIPAFVLLSHTQHTSKYRQSLTPVMWLQCNPCYTCISARSLPLYIKHKMNWAFFLSRLKQTSPNQQRKITVLDWCYTRKKGHNQTDLDNLWYLLLGMRVN